MFAKWIAFYSYFYLRGVAYKYSITITRFRFLDIRFSKVYSITCSFIIISRIHLENRTDAKIGIFPIPIVYWSGFGIFKQSRENPDTTKTVGHAVSICSNFFLFLQKNVFKNQNKFACDLPRFLPSGAQLLCSSARMLKVQLWSKLGADSLCSELSESCVILTLQLFVSQPVANFCSSLN